MMGGYRAGDLVRVPGLLSLVRIPLAAAFPFAMNWPAAALAILIAAGVSDVLDGWYARRFGQVTPTGTALDPVTDKLFVGAVAITLLARKTITVTDLALLGIRDLGELPLVLWLATSPRARKLRAEQPAANLPGKLATVFQFAAVAAAVLNLPHLQATMGAAGMSGAIAAASYWVRAQRDASRAVVSVGPKRGA